MENTRKLVKECQTFKIFFTKIFETSGLIDIEKVQLYAFHLRLKFLEIQVLQTTRSA